MQKHTFVVNYDPPPIPTKNNGMDWSAVSDNYEADDPIGYGATPLEAMADLIDQIMARES